MAYTSLSLYCKHLYINIILYLYINGILCILMLCMTPSSLWSLSALPLYTSLSLLYTSTHK